MARLKAAFEVIIVMNVLILYVIIKLACCNGHVNTRATYW